MPQACHECSFACQLGNWSATIRTISVGEMMRLEDALELEPMNQLMVDVISNECARPAIPERVEWITTLLG